MHNDVQLMLLGGLAGSLYALLALGLVVVYRSSGVLNLGHGAVATFGTYSFLHAVNAWAWPTWLSIVFGIVASTALGTAFQWLIIRRLRQAPALARLVSTLGLLVFTTGAVYMVFGDELPQPTRILPTGRFVLPVGSPGFVVPHDRLILAAMATVVSGVLWFVYRSTRFGKASRAAADNERAAALLGLDWARIEAVNWAIGSALAGLAGVSLSLIMQPSAESFTSILIFAIAAALAGNFRSYALLLVTAVVLGAAQSVLLSRGGQLKDLTGMEGWGSALPLLVIIGSVLLGGRVVAVKGSLDVQRLPRATRSTRPLPTAAAVLGIGALWYAFAPLGWVDPSTGSVIGAVMALSLVVVTGYGGQLSLAQMTFAGFGAFVAARLATDVGVPFPLPILLGGLAAVPVGALIGAPAVRVRGVSLAVVTLGAAVVMDVMFFTNRSLTGADRGLAVRPASLFGIDLSSTSAPRAFGWAMLVVAVAAATGVAFLRSSSLGTRLLALRANERAAAAVGMSVARTKLLAFAIGALVAGVAGGMYGYRSMQVSWSSFGFMTSIALVSVAYVGGVASVRGAAIAGLLINGGLVGHLLRFDGTARHIMDLLTGLGVMLAVVNHPDGFAGLPRQFRDAVGHRRSSSVRREAPMSLGGVEA